MKLQQDPLTFNPISLILETPEEANILLSIVEYFDKEDMEDGLITTDMYDFCIELSNKFFDNEAIITNL